MNKSDALAIVLVALLLGAVMNPCARGTASRRGAPTAYCANNLREIGAGLQEFANDHQRRFPAEVSAEQGGSLETPLAQQPAASFNVIRDSLAPVGGRQFICPIDSRKAEQSALRPLDNGRVSYFMSLDSLPASPELITCGDRYLLYKGISVRRGIFPLTRGADLVWDPRMHTISNNACGNILFADGHVCALVRSLSGALARQTIATNRIAIP
jgi:prepilin-type processing-associated H-X9-DG protein